MSLYRIQMRTVAAPRDLEKWSLKAGEVFAVIDAETGPKALDKFCALAERAKLPRELFAKEYWIFPVSDEEKAHPAYTPSAETLKLTQKEPLR